MVFKKGHKPWIKGRHHTEETRKKISLATKKKMDLPEIRNKMRKAATGRKYPIDKYPSHGMRGKKMSEETRNKMSESRKGEKHPMYGKNHTEESKRKMRESSKGQIAWNRGLKGIMVPWNKGLTAQVDDRILQKEKHGGWKGGKSFKPYGLDFNKKFKREIRKRDNHTCMLCNKFQEELRMKLDVHHVDYIKINNFPQNCISLCRKCHGLTHFNRKQWTLYFQSLMKELYQYEYTQDQKIILDFTEEI